MNKKISQFPGIITLQDGYLIPAVKDGVNYVFNTASLKSYLNKTDVGLSAVDNTSDINKPISAATQTAISGLSAILFNKTDIGHLHSASDISDLTNMFSGYSRINHTHTVADITDLVLPNMSLYATVQDVLARTTEARVLQLITQNTTGAVDLGPTNVRIDNAIIRIAGVEANVVQNQITANTHSAQISSINNRVDAIEATGLDTADLQTINNQFTVLTNSLSAKANVAHTHTTSQITDFAATVGNLIASVVNVNAINADLNGIHADLLAIHTSLDGKAATTHIHAISSITGLQAALDAKSGITHVHDFNGVTGLQTALDAKTDAGHTHQTSSIVGLDATLADLADQIANGGSGAPLVHNHVVSDVTGLQTILDSKTNTGHTHVTDDITGLETLINNTLGDFALTPGTPGDSNFADVELLLHGDGADGTNNFVDNSASPATLTVVGSVIHSATFKKFGNSSIETSDKYSKIQVVKSSNIDLTGNYTIECFVRTNSNTNIDYNSIITTNDNVFPSRYGLDFGVTGSNTLIARIVTASNTAVFSATNAYTLGDLAHIAFVNNNTSNIFNIFINGVLSGTRAAVPFFNSNTFQIAKCSNYWAETPYQIDELRITKNVVRYTANFTPPTAAFLDTAGTPATSGSLTAALAAKAPLVHNHALIDITGLQNALDAKASVSHTHTASNITDFSSVVTDIIDQQIIASNSSTGDTYYNNVVLLLHGTGANNSTVFTDSSPTPKTITVYGNAKISTTQSKFSGSSLYFDGSGDYLSIATSQDFDLGNVYTIEFFVYNLNATSAGGILHKGYYSSITHLWSGFAFSIRGIGTATRFYFYASTNVDERYIDVPASLPQNAWQHVAMVRNGSSGAVYIDGVPSGTITGLNSTVPSSETLRVGLWDFNGASEYFNGHLAEVRVTKGVARYTAAFAPPAIEFPNINSGGGTPGMLSTALTDLAAQIAAINSGSGSGASSGFTRMDVITSSGSWTIPPGVSAIKATVIGGGGAGAYGSVSSNLDYSSGGGGGGGGASVKYLTDLTPGATLLATVGNGGVSTNGSIGQGSVSKLTSLTQSISTINADGGDGAGRVINCDGGLGSLAAYIAASGDPYYSNVSLLLHMDGANNSTVFTDSSPTPKTIIANGDAVINTSKAKLGTGALSVTTSGSLTSSTAGITDFTTNNFTIECSFKAAVIQSSVLIATGDGVTAVGTGVYLYTVGNGIYFFCYSGSTGFYVGAANCFNVDTYTHVAVIRAGVKLMLFVDGFLVSSITTLGTSSINTITPISIGRTGSVQFNGYIDEVRITKGIARYSGNFLTPVVAYPDSGSVYDGNYGNVALLLHMDGGNNSTVFTDNSPNPKTVTVYGNAKISTAQSKFSGSSLYCDGNGDYIEIAAGTSTDFNIGLSDFVVETFYFPTSSSIDQTLIAVGEPVISTGANLGYAITHFGSSLSGKVRASFYSGTTQYFVDSSAALSLNVWNHIAFVRISGVIYLYVNGVQQSSLSANFNINTSNTFIAKIGKYDNNTTRYLSGYLDELRITKGVGRYATGFTPVVSAFPNLAAPDTFPMTGSSVISIPGNSGDNGMFGSIDLNTAGMQNAKLLKGGSGGDAAIISAGGGVYNPISASYSNGQAYGAGGAGGGIVYNSTTLQYSGSKGGNGANGVIIIEY